MAKKRKKTVKKSAPKKATVCKPCTKKCNWFMGLISEVAMYFFFYYALYLLQVNANFWLAALALWALVNVSFWTCPLVRKCNSC